jgi:hypothetical protein
VCGVWRVVCGVWRVVCGLWFVVCGLWFVVCGVCGRGARVRVPLGPGPAHGRAAAQRAQGRSRARSAPATPAQPSTAGARPHLQVVDRLRHVVRRVAAEADEANVAHAAAGRRQRGVVHGRQLHALAPQRHVAVLQPQRRLGAAGHAGDLLAAARQPHAHLGAALRARGQGARRRGEAVAEAGCTGSRPAGQALAKAAPRPASVASPGPRQQQPTSSPSAAPPQHIQRQHIPAHPAHPGAPAPQLPAAGPTCPRSTFAAISPVHPSMERPSMDITSSPGCTPARSAGPPLMGASTSKWPWTGSLAMSRPTPCSSPSLDTLNCA